jgi:hypothetical protein
MQELNLDAYMDEAFKEIRECVNNSSASVEVKQQYIDSICMLAHSIEHEWTVDFGIGNPKRRTTLPRPITEEAMLSLERSTDMLVKIIKQRSDKAEKKS